MQNNLGGASLIGKLCRFAGLCSAIQTFLVRSSPEWDEGTICEISNTDLFVVLGEENRGINKVVKILMADGEVGWFDLEHNEQLSDVVKEAKT